MSVPFEIPDWLMPTDPPQAPSDTADVDPHRIEDLVNRFIAGKQEALFTGPDAYYRTTGGDAVDGAPAILDRLSDLRTATLASAGDDGTRFVLGPRLDAHLDDAGDGIDRHVAAQRDALTRQIIGERENLIQRAAQLEHNNDDKLAGLAEAHASAAQELARMNGEPEAAAMDAARSAIWRTAIDQRLTNGNGPQALTLFDRVQDQLTASDKLSLHTPMQVARQDQTAEQWIANQAPIEGPPLQERVGADPDLPLDTKHIIRAKVDAYDSAQESKRAATVQALDDQVRAAYRAQAANPGAYKPGTFARLADAYAAAGDLERADGARRVAEWESFMLAFTQASAERQQRMIEALPPGEKRDHAMGLRDLQAHLFSRDAFAAGTTVYKEVGPAVPIDDVEGRVRQARQIAQLRGGIPVMPFTARELSGMQRTLATGSEGEKEAVHARLARLPDDMAAMIEAKLAPPSGDTSATGIGAGNTMRIDAAPWMAIDEPSGAGNDDPPIEKAATTAEGRGGFGGAPQPEPDPISAEYRAADAEARRIVAEQAKAPNADGAATSGEQVESVGTEPAPGSDVYRTAEAEARAEQVMETVATDRAISKWLAKVQPGQAVSSELAERLSPDRKRQVEDLAVGGDASKTDPAVLETIVDGLKSRNPQERRQWAQTALYRYRSQLSADDFRKVVELQDDLDPEDGYSRSEIAKIRKQLASRPDTSDLDWAYKALEGDPGVHYFQYFMIGYDSNGRIRLWVLPEAARSFLKGGLDLLKGTKTGELTPEAVDTFTGITDAAGRAFGPIANGATFAAGGMRRWSKAELSRMRKQLAENRTNGRAWEKNREAFYEKLGTKCTVQITIVTGNGLRGRVDCLFRDRNGKIKVKEFKASLAPYLRPRQRRFFEDLKSSGGTIVGEGKGSFKGGRKIPKNTKVDIDHPNPQRP
jgi:hypothetical protein